MNFFIINLYRCRFGRARLESNENLAVGSVFYSVFALASQLSPELHSSGIQYLETETFKLHCLQTLTGKPKNRIEFAFS